MMKSTKKCPLFSTISLAADGDEVAIEKILNHYDAYISKASLRPFYDEHGNMYIVVDMELKGRIRAALIKAILVIVHYSFRMSRFLRCKNCVFSFIYHSF